MGRLGGATSSTSTTTPSLSQNPKVLNTLIDLALTLLVGFDLNGCLLSWRLVVSVSIEVAVIWHSF